MLMEGFNLDVLLYSLPTDMRKSINGLSILVHEELSRNPCSRGKVYVFCNRLRDKLKLLYWDGNGFCLLYKRLEKGRFQIPKDEEEVSLGVSELRWLFQGLDFKKLPKAAILSFTSYG